MKNQQKAEKKERAKVSFLYLVIFEKPGCVLAMVSTLPCTCWWVTRWETNSIASQKRPDTTILSSQTNRALGQSLRST